MDTHPANSAFETEFLKLFCAFILISLWLPAILLSQGSQARIEVQPYAINPHDVDDVFFLDSQYGWIVLGEDKRARSYLFRSNNGGKTWAEFNAPRLIDQTYFIDPQIGWAVRRVKSRGHYFAHLLRTRDGGSSWKQTMSEALDAKLPAGEFVVRMAFSDDNLGWFFSSGAGPPGSVLVTRDGGKSVEVLSTPEEDSGYSGIFALPNGRVWILGGEDILSTHDLGKTWEQQFAWVPPQLNFASTYLNSAWFFPDGPGWVVGQGIDKGIILGTNDFGGHWNRVFESSESLYLESVYFSDENDGCALGLSEHLFCTQDGGVTWADRNVLPPPTGTQANFFVKVVMLKSGRGFALRAGGFLYETEDGGQTWREFDPLARKQKGGG